MYLFTFIEKVFLGMSQNCGKHLCLNFIGTAPRDALYVRQRENGCAALVILGVNTHINFIVCCCLMCLSVIVNLTWLQLCYAYKLYTL